MLLGACYGTRQLNVVPPLYLTGSTTMDFLIIESYSSMLFVFRTFAGSSGYAILAMSIL